MILSNFKMTDAEIIARAERRYGQPKPEKDCTEICLRAQADGAECICPDPESFDEDVKMAKHELKGDF